ncbi:XdhC/CoxI family protein [Fundidesulfovibrio butyratiphilus]
MRTLYKTLCSWLDQGLCVAVATVSAQAGSAPRTAGAKMLLAPDGRMAGSVGGGLLEAETLRAARRMLDDPTSKPCLLSFDLSEVLAAGADMICGGHVEVFVERVDPGPQALVFRELLARLTAGRSCLLASPLAGGERLLAAPWPPKALAPTAGPGDDTSRPTSAPPWDITPDQAAMRFGPQVADLRCAGMVKAPDGDWLAEPLPAPAPLVLAGAGHVSRATAHLAARCGFRVVVLDDRPEFANRERFPEADEILVCPLSDCLEPLHLGPEAFVAVITRGHAHDAVVLAQALRSPAGYVGMIGSTRKRDAIYDSLKRQGFAQSDLDRVFCPIGLAIAAQTPEEIAVSIVGQLIAFRAGKTLR